MIYIKKTVQYIGGLLLIAVGINISKLTNLGISPVSSIPRAAELIWGITLGVATIAVHIVLILLQLLLLRKKFRVVNALGIVVGLVFGWMIDLTGTDTKAFGHLLAGFPVPQTYPLRLVYMAVSVLLIGLGVFIYLKPGWIPMAAEGLSQAVAEVSGKPFGDCKTLTDTVMILIAAVLQFAFLGGFSSFAGSNVVVREGTLIAAIFVGQVVKMLSRIEKKVKKHPN